MTCRLVAAALIVHVFASGAAGQSIADERAHFHHVRLNVTNVDVSIRFYSRVFGAVPVKFHCVSDALFTERSLIVFNKVAEPPPSELTSGIWHIGWGGVDVKNEYEWWKGRGIDIHTPISPLPGQDNAANNMDQFVSLRQRELHRLRQAGPRSATPLGGATRRSARSSRLKGGRSTTSPSPIARSSPCSSE